ncbi:transcriptional regulator [Salinibacterium sp. PAMC 21357]|uniref:transcriptional regulator n=1 Tax=Salinibacterium sp. PAMC 21357 TaxID=1112215 RepID=UPI00028A350F|nr:transcriptional regulator [Salinibacterium sp. PAMC 21357]
MRVRPLFDEAIHAPTRLRLCAMLRPLDEADFAAIAATLELSEANLSKTLRNLAEIGYIITSKQASPLRTDARQTTTVALTTQGRRAFDGHLAALHAMAAGISTEPLPEK